MDRLEAQARAWRGKLSVAVYLPDNKGHPRNNSRLEEIKSMHEKLEKDGVCEMSISILYANHSQDEPLPSNQVLKCVHAYMRISLQQLLNWGLWVVNPSISCA